MGPMDVLVFGFVAGLVVLAIASASVRRKGRQVARTKPCRSCGFSMVDAALHVCPECGNGFNPSDRRPYYGRSRALMRSLAILLLAFASTIAVANVDLPTYRVFQVDMYWVIQEVAGDTTFDHMEIVGRSDEHTEWSLIQSGERGGSGGGLPPDMPAGVSLNLTQVEFLWRDRRLVIVKDLSSGNWVDADGASIDASGVRGRLQAPSDFDRYLEALLTRDWYNGDLRDFYESEAFHPTGDYGPGTENPFHQKRQPFHYMGYGWGWGVQTTGLYATWALIWVVAVALIGLSFWVDRRKPSRRKPAATLPV